MRTCTKCGIEKHDSEFYHTSYVRKDGTRGRHTSCKDCDRVNRYRDRFRYALSRGRHNCNATAPQIEACFTGKCDICGVPEVECNTKLHMDHDHETGDFRGWICGKCNKGIGLLGDSPEGLQRALEYLEFAANLSR